MNIRLAEEKDYLQVEELMKQVHDMHVELCPNIYKPEEDDKVVGVLSYIFRMISGKVVVDRKVMFIESLAVDEKYRNRGIGRGLLDRAKEICKAKGCDSLELQVNAKNIRAWEIYKNMVLKKKVLIWN